MASSSFEWEYAQVVIHPGAAAWTDCRASSPPTKNATTLATVTVQVRLFNSEPLPIGFDSPRPAPPFAAKDFPDSFTVDPDLIRDGLMRPSGRAQATDFGDPCGIQFRHRIPDAARTPPLRDHVL